MGAIRDRVGQQVRPCPPCPRSQTVLRVPWAAVIALILEKGQRKLLPKARVLEDNLEESIGNGHGSGLGSRIRLQPVSCLPRLNIGPVRIQMFSYLFAQAPVEPSRVYHGPSLKRARCGTAFAMVWVNQRRFVQALRKIYLGQMPAFIPIGVAVAVPSCEAAAVVGWRQSPQARDRKPSRKAPSPFRSVGGSASARGAARAH
jgi:hypothetical protein